jgi:hypothetical protein
LFGLKRAPGRPREYASEAERTAVNNARRRAKRAAKRRRLEFDPETRQRRFRTDLGMPQVVAQDPPPSAVLAEREFALGNDYRDLIGIVVGDPLPGRSALDRRIQNLGAR